MHNPIPHEITLILERPMTFCLDKGCAIPKNADNRLMKNRDIVIDDRSTHEGDAWSKIEVESLMAVRLDDPRRRILIGELKAGQKVTESEIAARLGISRSPIREAFRVLER